MGAREHSLHNTWCKYKEIQTIVWSNLMKNPSWSWLCICIYTFQAQSLMFSVHLIKFIDTVWWSEAGSSPIQVCCVHLRFDSASELMQVKDWTCTRVSMSLVLQFGVYFSLLVTVQYYFTLSSYILPLHELTDESLFEYWFCNID